MQEPNVNFPKINKILSGLGGGRGKRATRLTPII
jgi:hypothetical protein